VLWLSGSAYDVIFDVARQAEPDADRRVRSRARAAGKAGSRRQRRARAEAGGLASNDQELTRYTHPLSGACYFVPSIEALQQACV